jgi:hypothetical protein
MKKKKISIEDRVIDLFGSLLPADNTEGVVDPIPDREDFDIVKLMGEAKDPDTGLIRDLRIDDRDLPSASSFYDYAYKIIGEDAHPPWLMQMWIGLMLFAEVCPICSDPRWFNI